MRSSPQVRVDDATVVTATGVPIASGPNCKAGGIIGSLVVPDSTGIGAGTPAGCAG